MTQTSATHLNLINRIDDRTGASVGMWAGIQAAPIEWGAVFSAHAYTSRSCCASTEGDVHDRSCDTAAARAEWAPRSQRIA